MIPTNVYIQKIMSIFGPITMDVVCGPRPKNGKCCYQIVDHLKGRFLRFHKILVLLEICSTICNLP